MGMETVKIIMSAAESKSCICGATLFNCRDSNNERDTHVWRCARDCGARDLTYAGALRHKVRLDLLSWDDLRRKTQALIEADSDDRSSFPCSELFLWACLSVLSGRLRTAAAS